MDIKMTISEMLETIKAFKEELIKELGNIPDNSKIKRIGNNCFTISFKDLNDNWSPQHHDTLAQAKILQEIIRKSENLKAIQNILKSVVVTGRISHKEYRNLVFHDDVRAFVKKMLGEITEVANSQ